ncbi:amidohydrolase family protein [Desulforhopalus singaporensis]|uniref:N-acyl-D-amino-acid deacylase n=1 Tax=Desulforhopalus singaporensis TaxID=91360 RepID=A0A1H0TG08_9BACT|nr:hypothetical protein [Desulforhopalus singaporensis]SDP52610.1 N-acyl-D-amino-acid deacylase [Desulforhopalus singaporensis]
MLWVKLLEQSLEEGAFGLTTGLEYNPGKMANYDEIAALCGVVARADGFYATHSRNRDSRYLVGFREALDVARKTGVRLQISHITPKYGRPEHAMRNTVQMIEWTREEGVDVAMDMMPTNWNHTNATALLPSWSSALAKDQLFAQMKSTKGRERLKKNPLPIWKLAVDEKWDKIRLLASSANADKCGMTIDEIARKRKTTGWDVVFDLILEDGDGYQGVFLTGEGFSEADNRLVLQSFLYVQWNRTLWLWPTTVLLRKYDWEVFLVTTGAQNLLVIIFVTKKC